MQVAHRFQPFLTKDFLFYFLKTIGALDAVRQIYETKGIKGFYKGFTPCIARCFPANAALLVHRSYLSVIKR
jgi:hypothetical protein